MSLIKQLWIATLCLTLLALGGSLVVGTLSARDYLVQALTVKNIDNAGGALLLFGQLSMGGACGMDNQRFCIGYIGQMRKYLNTIYKPLAGFNITFYSESEY